MMVQATPQPARGTETPETVKANGLRFLECLKIAKDKK